MPYSRVNEIDLLRFIAALAVVFFHYAFRGYAADGLSVMPYPWLAPAAKYGYLGANLFFIISGFVILMTAEQGGLRRFLVSRAVRLYPAFWACCTITFVLILLLGAPRYEATPGQYLANMTMLSGFAGVDWIDGSYWTLFVEVKFYALVCAVLVLRRMRHVQALLWGWLALSFLAEAWPDKYLRYFLIVDYSVYFIAGATCFLVWSRGLSGARVAMLLLCWALALFQSAKAVAGMNRHYGAGHGGPGHGGPVMDSAVSAVLITIFFAVMLMVALRATGGVGRARWTLAGALTYPLYLIHQNAGYIVFNLGYPALDAHLLFWGTFALMLLLAYAVHVHVERRFSPLLKQALERFADNAGRVRPRLRAGLLVRMRARSRARSRARAGLGTKTSR